MKFLQGLLKEHILFVALLVVFILTPVAYFSYVPIWDGYQFVKLCYVPSSQTLLLDCARHSAPFNNLLFGFIQKIDIGNPLLIYTENIILGVIGLVFFYLLLKDVFGDLLTAYERALLTFLFGFHPVFLAHIVQPSLDYTLPIYLVVLLFFLLRNNYIWTAVSGLMLAFTKEPGIMVYGVSVFWYFYVFAGLGKRKELISGHLKEIWVLLIPFAAFALYAHFFTLQAHRDDGIFLEMFSFNTSHDFFVEQIESIAIINFYWTVTVSILAGSAYFIYKNAKHRIDLEHITPIGLNTIYLSLCTVSVLWFNTRIEFFNNPRYMLLCVPLLVLSFTCVYAHFKGKILRVVMLSALLSIIYLSAFRTFDPVSRYVFPTFRFGSHTMLKTPVSKTVLGVDYAGKDTLVYNFQFTEFDSLTEKAVRTFGLDKNYVMSRMFLGGSNGIFSDFDKRMQHRSLAGKSGNSEVVQVNILDDNQALGDKDLHDVYFIAMPAHYSEASMKNLLKSFVVTGATTIEDSGYSVDVIHLVRK